MKLILILSTLMLSVPAWAQTRVMTEHTSSANALGCLLNHDRDCGLNFVASAHGVAKPWLWWNSTADLDLGPLMSWHYAGTQAQNFFTTGAFNGNDAKCGYACHTRVASQDYIYTAYPPR